MYRKRQEPTDLKELVAELLPRLYNTARYLAGNSDRAEDAVQETMLELIRNLREDPSRIRNPLGWSFRVLNRICRKRRPPSIPLKEEIPQNHPGPEKAALTEELREQVRRSLRTLPPEEREVICLHVFGGLSIRDLASTLDLPKSTAHERFRRGLGGLRKKLGSMAPALLPPISGNRLVGWLQSLPPAPVPEALTNTVLSSAGSATVALSSAGALSTVKTMPLGGLAMSLSTSKITLMGAALVLLAASVGLSVKVLELKKKNRSLRISGVVPVEHENRYTALSRENQVLRKANGELREELADLRKQLASLQNPGRKLQVAGKPPTPGEIEELLSRALAALEDRDTTGFAGAFLALVDTGEPGHAALMSILAETGDYNRIFAALETEDYDFRRDFIGKVTERRTLLGGFLDAVLSRPDSLDGATLFAFDLMRYNGVETRLPREQHISSILEVLNLALDTEEDHVNWNIYSVTAAFILGRLRAREALPELGRLLSAPALSDSNRIALAQAVAEIGGEGAVEILKGLRDSLGARLREHLLLNLAHHGGDEIELFLEKSLARENGELEISLLRELGKRKKNHARIVERLADPGIDHRERMTILEILFENGDSYHREKAWKHVENLDVKTQDEIIESLAGRDPRATEMLLERLRSDSVSRGFLSACYRLDSKQVHRFRDDLQGIAMNAGATPLARGAAATALARIDPPGAVRMLLNGFSQIPEKDRLQLVEILGDFIGGKEAREQLEAIAGSDLSERVRKAASSHAAR